MKSGKIYWLNKQFMRLPKGVYAYATFDRKKHAVVVRATIQGKPHTLELPDRGLSTKKVLYAVWLLYC